MRTLFVLLAFTLFASITHAETYPLDDVPREFSAHQKLPCAKDLIKHKSPSIAYSKTMRVNPHFSKKLLQLEQIAHDVGLEVFGRAPKKINHFGGYKCRRIRRYPTTLSEHALGNAIDLVSFQFARAPQPRKLKRKFAKPFNVSVKKHWGAKNKKGIFLQRFTEELIKSKLFRTMLGPAYPGHDDHFHFDMAPYEIISI